MNPFRRKPSVEPGPEAGALVRAVFTELRKNEGWSEIAEGLSRTDLESVVLAGMAGYLTAAIDTLARLAGTNFDEYWQGFCLGELKREAESK